MTTHIVSWLLMVMLPFAVSGESLSVQTCSSGNAAVIQPGAIANLGGLVSLHGQGSSGYGCGEGYSGSMQAYEAIRWVLDLLNKKNETLQTMFLPDSYIPGISLGMKVRDHCGNTDTELGSLSQVYPEIDGQADTCQAQTNGLMFGIVSASSSGATVPLAKAAQQYDIPVISYEASVPDLTLSGMHPNFMRTIAPDGPLADVIIQVMIQLKWKFIAIMYEEGLYGQTSFENLQARAVANGICVTAGVMFNRLESSNEQVKERLDQVEGSQAVGVIFIGSANYALSLLSVADSDRSMYGRLQWLIVDFVLDTAFPSQQFYQRGIITVTPASRFIVEFEDHWIRLNAKNPSPENPWFKRWYEMANKCKFSPAPGESNCENTDPSKTQDDIELEKRAAYQQSQYVEPAVMSIFTYARALREAHADKCGGISGPCAALLNMEREDFLENYLKKVDFEFTSLERVPSLASLNVEPYNAVKHLAFTPQGDIKNPSFYIWNYNDIETGAGAQGFKFRRVGTYINDVLNFNLNNAAMYDTSRTTRISLPSSPCPGKCTPCLSLPSEVKYYYEPGDLIINGIFSLHNKGSTDLTCWGIKSPNQVLYLEAMIYAIKKINLDPNVLANVKLGGLGMDDCSSSVLGQAFITEVQRGGLQINKDGGSRLDPRTIEGYTGAYTSPLTLPLAHIMNILKRPLVGYRAGSTELMDEMKFPYYLSAVPDVKQEIQAIILLLKKYNWMYVQVVTSYSYYSMNAEKTFRELAAKAGICIVATTNLGISDRDAMNAVTGLQAMTNAPPTIALLDSMDQRRLLVALSDNPSVRARIALIATTRWGTDQTVIKGYESAAQGVITLGFRKSTLANFMVYLRSLQLQTAQKVNPWFGEWFSTVYNCSIGLSQAGLPQCDETVPITDAAGFYLLREVESVINSVEALARALHQTLVQYCGNGYTHVCSSFMTNTGKGTDLMQKLKDIAFTIEDTQPAEVFKFDGKSAALSFDVFNIRPAGQYYKIASVNPLENSITLMEDDMSDTFLFNNEAVKDVVTSCPEPCLECLYMFHYIDYWYTPGDLVIGAIFDVHYSGEGPFMCDDLRINNGARYTEVFNFALQKINRDHQLNVDLGGLAFDGCTNPSRATAILNRVQTGMTITADGGEKFSTADLIAWMTFDSETTEDSALLLQQIGMPLVSPAATLPQLANIEKYYTLFRTVPSDAVVARGMAEFVMNMGWEYVQLVNAPEASSREAAKLFISYLKEYGICVIAQYEFVTDGNMDVIWNSLTNVENQVVAVFADPDRYIGDFLQTNIDQGYSKELRFIANRPWDTFYSAYASVLRNSVYFVLDSPTIQEFTNYLKTQNVMSKNPWFGAIYEQIFSCNLPGSFKYPSGRNCDTSQEIWKEWKQDIYTLSTINAVYALADAANTVLTDKCGGGYNSVCSSFLTSSDTKQSLMTAMDLLTFQDISGTLFDFVERQANSGYVMKRFDDVALIEGSLNHNGNLTLLSVGGMRVIYANVETKCSQDCLQCQDSEDKTPEFTLIYGDIYLVGLFDVHDEGSTPFKCGSINEKHGLPLLEAFNYALEYVNAKKGIFKNLLANVVIGGIALDMCKSPSRAANLVANIQSGKTVLSKNGVTLNPKKIDAYVATMDTKSTVRVADVLTQLAMPQISYGASGVELLDMDKYDYFLRSVPADDKQARAIVSYLKKFRYNNIQVVYSFDEIGEPGAEEFEKLAEINLVCITKKFIVNEPGNPASDPDMVMQHVVNNSEAQVIVLWLKHPVSVLTAANSVLNVNNRVLFIATDKWGFNTASLKMPTLENFLNKNLIVLDVETADIPGFDEYLDTKTPSNYDRNPWFKEYYEATYKCSWDGPASPSAPLCDRSRSIPRYDSYIQDPYVLYVINAVFSAVLGIHNGLLELCDTNRISGVCDLYRTSGERRQVVMRGLKKVNFIDDTLQPFFYTADGQSDRGFHFYNVTKQGSQFFYDNIGSFNDTHFLKLDITYDSDFSAVCEPWQGAGKAEKPCVCQFKPDLPSRFMKTQDGKRGLTLVYVGDVHQAVPNNRFACGPINTGVDLQKLMAFFYAIKLINTNINFDLQDSIRLDGVALDSCTSSLRLGQDVYNLLSGNPLCDSDEPGQVVVPSSIVMFVLDKDRNALPVSSMLASSEITSISPSAGHSILNDLFRHPYFLRTHGDDQQVADVILQVADAAAWNLLTVIYSNNIGQISAKDTLLDKAQSRSRQVCVSAAASLDMDATVADAEGILDFISQKVGVRGVVLFVEPAHIGLIMQASQNLGLTGRNVWIFPADYAEQDMNIENLEREMSGSIIIKTRSAIVEQFKTYMKSLNFNNREGIPDDWFNEIYETLHQCNILNTESRIGRRYPRICTGNEVITDAMLSEDPSVLHIIISVYAAALGLDNIAECDGTKLDIAGCLQLQQHRNQLIYRGVLGVNFKVLPDKLGSNSFDFSFDLNGNGQAGYLIYNYQPSEGLQQVYTSNSIGSYSTQGLSIDMSKYIATSRVNQGQVPTSNCVAGICQACVLKNGGTHNFTVNEEATLENPQVGSTYEDPKSGELIILEGIPGVDSRFSDTWAIIIIVLASLGAAISLGIFIYLLIMYPVRGGTTILGYLLCFGIILLYLMVFAFIAHADERICGLRRFALGFVYAIVYSSLLVKLIDCWRVRGKNDAYNIKYSKLGRPSGLFFVVTCLILVQVIINVEWLILRAPDTTRVFYNNLYWPRCTPDDFSDKGLILSLVYIMAMILFSFFLGIATFTQVKNHRESRWILAVLTFSIPCWVIWCAVATLGEYKVRDAAVAVGLLINATVMLLLVPIRKLYLLHKYNVLIEREERQDPYSGSAQADYSSVYERQYDNIPRLHDTGSVHGSTSSFHSPRYGTGGVPRY